MKNDNTVAWADALATTTDEQCTGALSLMEGGKQKFCCLGFGAQRLVPGIRITLPSGAVPPSYNRVYYGEAGADGLAPVEFMQWLGYDADALTDTIQWDVFFDIPRDLRLRSFQDMEASREDGGDDRHDNEGGPMFTGLSAASLNDDGHSFTQIADMIRYFGLCDTLRPLDA